MDDPARNGLQPQGRMQRTPREFSQRDSLTPSRFAMERSMTARHGPESVAVRWSGTQGREPITECGRQPLAGDDLFQLGRKWLWLG
jgi:hypothetical protein